MSRSDVFTDRAEAGRLLGEELRGRLVDQPAVVLGLPRGGVSVAAPVARALNAPLDVLVVRKIGVPSQPELAMGALAHGTVVRNEDVIRSLGIGEKAFAAAAEKERAVAERRERDYRGVRPPAALAGATAVVVDDGLATGATARAALTALRHRETDRPDRVVLAIPVGPPDSVREVGALADEVVCLHQPWHFYAVGAWYLEFSQVSDDEVRAMLAEQAG